LIRKGLYDVDTHGIVENGKKWLHEWGYIANISSFSSNSMEEGILFKNWFEFKIHDEVKDTLGNYSILVILIQYYGMALAAIYGPNEDKPCFQPFIATSTISHSKKKYIALNPAHSVNFRNIFF
jgi:hypothetical protein